MTKVNGIKKSMSPLLTVSSVVGLGRLEYPSGKSRLGLTLLYIAVLWITYVIAMYHSLPVFLREVVGSDSMYMLSLCFNIFIMFMSTIINLYNDKERIQDLVSRTCTWPEKGPCLLILLHTAVDETLEAFGVSRGYSKQYKTTLRYVFIWFCCSSLMTVSTSWLITWQRMELIFEAVWIICVSNCAFYVNSILSLSFGVLLGCMSTRLDRVNEHMNTKLGNDKASKRGRFQERLFLSSRNPINDEKNKRMLWTAMHLHSEICKISRELNALFEIQISLEMISVFVWLVGQCVHYYRSRLIIREGIFHAMMYIFLNTEWAALCIVKLYYVNNACDIVSSKANNTKGIIDEAIDTLRNTEDRKDMVQFILQIIHKPLKFTGMGCFDLGHDFIHRLLIFVTTVVIIMLQMDIVPNIHYNLQYKYKNGTSV